MYFPLVYFPICISRAAISILWFPEFNLSSLIFRFMFSDLYVFHIFRVAFFDVVLKMFVSRLHFPFCISRYIFSELYAHDQYFPIRILPTSISRFVIPVQHFPISINRIAFFSICIYRYCSVRFYFF